MRVRLADDQRALRLPEADGGAGLGPSEAALVPLRSLDPLTPPHRMPGGTSPPVRGPAASLLTPAERLGAAVRVRGPAAQHARAREQFGRSVAAFQAMAHLCAGMRVRAETARAAVYAAAVTGDPAGIAGARLLADEAAVRGRPRLPPGPRRHGLHLGVRGPPASETRMGSNPTHRESNGE